MPSGHLPVTAQATDVGSAAFEVARFALAVAGALFLLYAMLIVILAALSRWVGR